MAAPYGIHAMLSTLRQTTSSFYWGSTKVKYPKYYKYLKKGGQKSHLGRQNWDIKQDMNLDYNPEFSHNKLCSTIVCAKVDIKCLEYLESITLGSTSHEVDQANKWCTMQQFDQKKCFENFPLN